MTTPFDFGPFGIGTPIDAPAPPMVKASMSRYIDPVSKDFGVDPFTGNLRSMPGVRQRFLLLAATLLGSSSVLPDLGIVFPTIIDDSFARRVDVAIRSAASHMTDVEKVARINKVSVTTGSLGRVLVLIAYDDLTLGVSDSISVPIQ